MERFLARYDPSYSAPNISTTWVTNKKKWGFTLGYMLQVFVYDR